MWKWTFEKLPNSRAPIRLLNKILAVPAVLELPHRFLIYNGQVIVIHILSAAIVALQLSRFSAKDK